MRRRIIRDETGTCVVRVGKSSQRENSSHTGAGKTDEQMSGRVGGAGAADEIAETQRHT